MSDVKIGLKLNKFLTARNFIIRGGARTFLCCDFSLWRNVNRCIMLSSATRCKIMPEKREKCFQFSFSVVLDIVPIIMTKENKLGSRWWNVCLQCCFPNTRTNDNRRQRYRHHNSLILGFRVKSRPQNAFISLVRFIFSDETYDALMQRLLKSLAFIITWEELCVFVGHIMMMQRNPVSNVVFIRMSDNVKSNIFFLWLWNVNNQTCNDRSFAHSDSRTNMTRREMRSSNFFRLT